MLLPIFTKYEPGFGTCRSTLGAPVRPAWMMRPCMSNNASGMPTSAPSMWMLRPAILTTIFTSQTGAIRSVLLDDDLPLLLDFAELLLDLAELLLDLAELLLDSTELLLDFTLEEDSGVTLELDFSLLLDTIAELELDFCSELELASLLEDATELLNAWQAG